MRTRKKPLPFEGAAVNAGEGHKYFRLWVASELLRLDRRDGGLMHLADAGLEQWAKTELWRTVGRE